MKFSKFSFLCFCLLFAGLSALSSGCASRPPARTVIPRAYASNKGEYGGNLDILRRNLTGPVNSKESNFYLDIWGNGEITSYARAHGLTNNHAFFVISHGGGLKTAQGVRHAYYPERSAKTSRHFFSARDLAEVLGPEKVYSVHNLVIAGCNWDDTFSSAELRQHFPNATNIVHSLPGRNAHETLFRHALIYASRDIKTLYLQPDSFQVGHFGDKWREKKAQPYVAELFRPGELFPYKIQTAGRELLEKTRLAHSQQASAPPQTTAN